MMVEKSVATLVSHPAIAARGPDMLLRNLNGILFGPMMSQSWENQISREEGKNTKISFQKTNEASAKRVAQFFTSKKVRATSGNALLLALLNPTCRSESFEHRMVLLWLGGRLFKVDGVKRSGVLGRTTEQTTWPVAVSELPEQGAPFYAALQKFVPQGNPKGEWDAEKAAAWDAIVVQHGAHAARSQPFASQLDLKSKGPHMFVCLTQDEQGLQVDLKNGLVERLKAISLQLDAMK